MGNRDGVVFVETPICENGGGFYDIFIRAPTLSAYSSICDKKFDSLVTSEILVIGNTTSQLYP